MNIQRAKPAEDPNVHTNRPSKEKKRKVPRHEDFNQARDFTGAFTVLEFQRLTSNNPSPELSSWIAYYAFHLGDYTKAKEEYLKLTQLPSCPPDTWTQLACCYFYLGMYEEAEAAAQKGPKNKLQNRLLFHLSQKFSDEKKLRSYHLNLQDVSEDQLSLAAMHYLRTHYQVAHVPGHHATLCCAYCCAFRKPSTSTNASYSATENSTR